MGAIGPAGVTVRRPSLSPLLALTRMSRIHSTPVTIRRLRRAQPPRRPPRIRLHE
jgi:hypothetical protein